MNSVCIRFFLAVARATTPLILQRNVLALVLLSLAVLTGCGGNSENTTSQSETPRTKPGRTLDYTRNIQFLNEDSGVISEIRAAVVDDDDSRNMGLMDVHDLPENRGMLFVFHMQAPLSFWMANTPLSLDIIFVNKDFEIVRIHHSTPPYSEQSFESGSDAMYAIEVNAGYCVRHDIREGLKVAF